MYSLVPFWQTESGARANEVNFCRTIEQAELWHLLLGLSAEGQLSAQGGVLTHQLIVLFDELLCLFRLPCELTGHLLVLGDSAFGGQYSFCMQW